MLFLKLALASLGAILVLLLGSASAQPTGLTANLTTTATARGEVWQLAPEECSRDNIHCLVVESIANQGFKNLYCGLSWKKDWISYTVYAFNKGCYGQIAMYCPDKNSTRRRGLTHFDFAPHSFFSTDDDRVKGTTSCNQAFSSSPPEYNNRWCEVNYADFFLQCTNSQ